MSDTFKILAGSASMYIGEGIASAMETSLGNVILQRFSDGEFQPSIEETVRGKDVIIVQSTFPPTDNLFELLLLIDAAKRASAKRIVAVMPYFGFARQDRKDKPRVAIGAKLVANLLTAAGVNRVITMDLHAEQIQGFFEVPVDHLYASTLFMPYLQSLNIPDLIIAAPDTGGTKRANAYAKMLGVDLAICYKQRKVANKVESMTVIGDVAGKNVVLVDDMVDTAGTLCKAAEMMLEAGASIRRPREVVREMLAWNRRNCRQRGGTSQSHHSGFCHGSSNPSRTRSIAIGSELCSLTIIQRIQSLCMPEGFMLSKFEHRQYPEIADSRWSQCTKTRTHKGYKAVSRLCILSLMLAILRLFSRQQSRIVMLTCSSIPSFIPYTIYIHHCHSLNINNKILSSCAMSLRSISNLHFISTNKNVSPRLRGEASALTESNFHHFKGGAEMLKLC